MNLMVVISPMYKQLEFAPSMQKSFNYIRNAQLYEHINNITLRDEIYAEVIYAEFIYANLALIRIIKFHIFMQIWP